MKTVKECRLDIYTFIRSEVGEIDDRKLSGLSELLKEYVKTVTKIRDKEKKLLDDKIEKLKKDIVNLKKGKVGIYKKIPKKTYKKKGEDNPFFNSDFLNKG